MAKDKNKKEERRQAEETVKVSISAHPRAKAGIRRARTRAALIAFMLVLVLNLVGDQTSSTPSGARCSPASSST